MTKLVANSRQNFNAAWQSEDQNRILDLLFHEHFAHASRALKDRLYAAITPNVSGDAHVHLARVSFERTLFEFDVTGRWAVVVPVISNCAISDWAAFDIDDDLHRGTLLLESYAVGVDQAELDAHHHPKSRLVISFSVWTWLRNEAIGILPVCWPRTAAYLIATGYAIEGHTTADALLAEDALQRATAIPPMYSREEYEE